MREIKFRAWDKINKKMDYKGIVWDVAEFLYISFPKGKLCVTHRGLLDEPTDDYILMQYTGLKDKNGKEIYEGDILKSPLGEIDEVVYESEAELSHAQGCIAGWYVGEGSESEVIGNVYENPELLEDKNEKP